MKIFKLILVAVLCLTTATIFSQVNNSTADAPYIEVTGTAEMKIVPDEIYISITLHERIENKVKITIAEQETKLKTELTNLNIPLTDLYLSDANANYVKVKWTKKDVMAQTEYILKVGDAKTVGIVFEKLDDLKIHDANVDRVSHSKIEEYRKEVKIMAIKAAKEKADYLLSAIGSQVYRPLIVTENNVNALRNVNAINVRKSSNRYKYYNSSDLNDREQIINFQKITLQASIYVKFEIK